MSLRRNTNTPRSPGSRRRRLLVAVCIVTVAALTLPPSGTVAARSTATRAEKAAAKKKLKVDRHLAMAQYFEVRERNAKMARKEYAAVLKVDRQHVAAALAVARIDWAAGKQKAALKTLGKIAKAKPDAPPVHELLADLYERSDDAVAAAASWRKLLTLNPGHAEAHRRLALLARKRMDSGEAAARAEVLEHLQAYLRHDSNKKGLRNAAARRWLAELQGGELAVVIVDATTAWESAWSDNRMQNINRRMAQAREGFERCLSLDPKAEVCHYHLGRIFSSVKASDEYDAQRARAAFEKAPGIPDAHVQLAIIARKEGDDTAALRSLDTAVGLDPTHQSAWLELGLHRKLSGEDDTAVEAFERSYRLDPRSSVASKALGELNILQPDHALVQRALRFGSVKGDLFSSEKFKSAVTAFERRFGGVAPDAPEQAVLEEILSRLIEGAGIESPYPLSVNVLDTPIVNAFALPNGNMYFTKGFFEFVSKTLPDLPIDPDHGPLAHVMGHEIAHVLRQHVVRSEVFKQAVTDSGNSMPGTVLVHTTRIHEIEADREGMVIAFLAGYHPRGGIDFMEARGKAQEIPPHLDHPTYDERIHYLEEYWSNDVRYAWMSFSFGLAAMKTAAAAEVDDIAAAAVAFRKALDHFTRFAQTLKPTPEVLNNMGIAYAKLGLLRIADGNNPLLKFRAGFSIERDLALKYVSIRRKEGVDVADGPRTRGSGGKPTIPIELKQAVKRFKRAVRISPRYTRARVNLALGYLAIHQPGKAASQLEKIKPEPEGPFDAAHLEVLGGVAEALAGRKNKAIIRLTAVSSNPAVAAPAMFNLARVFEMSGDKANARAWFDRFLAKESTGPWADAARKATNSL